MFALMFFVALLVYGVSSIVLIIKIIVAERKESKDVR